MLTAGALALVAALACALYLPYLGNPPVFDDKVFFSGFRFAEHAGSPFVIRNRFPAYFSLAFTQVVSGRIEVHRIVSLLLHVGCACALYAFIRALQLRRLAALAGAALFAVHPVAVYGAAYLTERSIVVATLFALLALLLFVRGLRGGSYSDAIAAAVLYSLAVLSKEHAILLPAVAAALIPLAGTRPRFALRYVGVYFVACAPAAMLALQLGKGFIGVVYEPHFETVVAQISHLPLAETVSSRWLGSVVVQAALFFRYLLVWFLPRTADMSLDLRVDFAHYWEPQIALPASFCFVASAALATYLLARRGRLAVAAFGFLYAWILFLTEFAAVRFQEPFVLYRSYLWAPGLALMVAAALDRFSSRWLLALLLPCVALLGWQAHDRLNTFSSGLALWQDAVAKLPATPVPGGHRPLYELGREYLYAGRPQDALDVTQRCLTEYPKTFDCFFARGAISIELEQYEEALPSIARAIALRPRYGPARHHLGLILENLGCTDDALKQYRLAVTLGFAGAAHRVQRIETPGTGLLAPAEAPVTQVDCADLLARNPIPPTE